MSAGATRRWSPRARVVWVASLAVVVVVAVVLALTVGRRGGGKAAVPDTPQVAAAMRAAGCTFRTYAVPAPPGGRIHLASRGSTARWSTTPPSAGPHFPVGSVLAFYGKPLEVAPILQDLENGAIVIWYGERIRPAVQNDLESFYQRSPAQMLASPYRGLGSRVALAAWTGDPHRYGRAGYWGEGHLAVCSAFHPTAFARFREAYRGRGPQPRPAA